jgi:predicted HTH transcriptional regulator
MIELTDHDLLLKLKNSEDAFVERKTSGDSKDWLKTVVALANSTPIGYPAVLFIGVKDDGTPEDNAVNLDSLQKTLSKQLANAYPPIYYLPKVLNANGKQVLAVIVPGSAERPHFAGQSYVRHGSQSVVASKEQFNALIASRSSKIYTILEWKDKSIQVGHIIPGEPRPYAFRTSTIVDCNEFWVTLKTGTALQALPLGRLELSCQELSRPYRAPCIAK